MTGEQAGNILAWYGVHFLPGEGSAVGDPLPDNITHLLKEWSAGDERALDRLTLLVYEELRHQAARYLRRERPGHTASWTQSNTGLLNTSVTAVAIDRNNPSIVLAGVEPTLVLWR